MPLSQQWVVPSSPGVLRDAALCFNIDFFEFAPELARAYQPMLVQALFAYATDADPHVRMTAFYGIGTLAEHGDARYDGHVGGACALLVEALNRPDAREGDNVLATDNAVSALMKLALFRGHAIGAQAPALARKMLELLPITQDETEGETVHSLVVQAVAAQHALIIGDGWRNLQRLLELFADLCCTCRFAATR